MKIKSNGFFNHALLPCIQLFYENLPNYLKNIRGAIFLNAVGGFLNLHANLKERNPFPRVSSRIL